MSIRNISTTVILIALAASAPAEPPPEPRTAPGATQESPAAAIERKMDKPIAGIAWDQKPLGDAFSALQSQMNANIAVNWPALESAGLTKETPVSFRARGITYEQALRILLDGLATDKGRLNYAVSDEGGGLLEISTMEAFGRDQRAKFFPARTLMAVTMEGASINAAGVPQPKSEVLLEVLQRELIDAGEAAKTTKLTYDERAGRVLYTGSARGQRILERLFPVLTNPPRPPAMPAPAVMPGRAKQTAEKWREKAESPQREHTLDDLANYLADVGKIQVAVMPGAVDPVMKRKLDPAVRTLGEGVESAAKAFGVTYEINRDGIVVFARKEQLEWHAVLCAYDVRETIKTLGKEGGVTKAATAILAAVKADVTEARGVAMIDGVLVFRAPDGVHRDFTRRFDTIMKDRKSP